VNPSTPAAKAVSEPAAKPKARCKAAGGVTLGRGRSREAQRQAALILEVLAGMRTPAQAAQALAVSVPRYYQLEGRALGALVAACEPCPKGRMRSPDHELAVLKRQHERLQRELIRQQTLVRIAQRNFGLPPPPPAPAPKNGGKKRRRLPAVRALGAAAHLQEQSQQTPTLERREQTT
jgi:hypothetical protein